VSAVQSILNTAFNLANQYNYITQPQYHRYRRNVDTVALATKIAKFGYDLIPARNTTKTIIRKNNTMPYRNSVIAKTTRRAGGSSSASVRPHYRASPTKGVVVYANHKRSKKAPSHYVDLPASTSSFLNLNFNTTGNIQLVATIPLGASVQERNGKVAQYKSFQVKGIMRNGTSADYNKCTWMLVYDRQPDGTLPAITDVLNTVHSYAFLNDVNSARFKVLVREDEVLVGDGVNFSTSKSCINVDVYTKCNLPIKFKAVGDGTIADLAIGAVYLITVGDNAAGTAAAEFIGRVRTRFVDKHG